MNIQPPQIHEKPILKVLLAEDEKNIALGISFNLTENGFDVLVLENGKTAFEKACTQHFDLVILDVMLPEMDGLEICQRLRAQKIHTPILMLTALSDTESKILGLQTGADDYLGKPFHLQELLVRVKALIRRRDWSAQATAGETDANALTPISNNIYLDMQNLLLVYSEKNSLCKSNKQSQNALLNMPLTIIEAKLLHLLVQHQNRTLSRLEILKQIWGFSENTRTRTLDMFVMRLRNHLEKAGGKGSWIRSVRGLGYRLDLSHQ